MTAHKEEYALLLHRFIPYYSLNNMSTLRFAYEPDSEYIAKL
jgi:hypothetical protein